MQQEVEGRNPQIPKNEWKKQQVTLKKQPKGRFILEFEQEGKTAPPKKKNGKKHRPR